MSVNFLENEKRENFSEESLFLDHLDFIVENEEWCYHNIENTDFSYFDSMSQIVMTVDGVEDYPVSDLALPSLIRRCEVTGDGIERLALHNKPVFCQHMIDYFGTKNNARTNLISCVLFGRVNAVHSGNYVPINQSEFFRAVLEFFSNSFSGVTFISGMYSESITEAVIEIDDDTLTGVYTALLSKYMSNGNGNDKVRCLVKILASDVGEVSCIVEPMLVCDSAVIPLGSKLSLRHTGKKATVENAVECISELFAKFTEQLRGLEFLEDIEIKNPKNAMIKAFTYLKFAQKYASDVVDIFVPQHYNALEIYVHMTKALANAKTESTYDNLRNDEKLARLTGITIKKWKSFDVSGTVAWSAKGN